MKHSHYYFWHWAAFLASLCAAAMVPQDKLGGLDAGAGNRSDEKKKVVCYYGSWATYRPESGKFDPENIDPFMCTHIIYGFVGLGFDNKLRLLDAYNDVYDNWGKGAMKRFTDLKKKNPELKAMVAIGGWNEGSEKYSNMASSASNRRTFIDSVIEFLPTQGFDGLDLDWEYPGHRGGKPEDKENYSLLIAELRSEFDKHGYILSAAVSAGEATIRVAYDVPSLARYLHFVNVMAYDFHGAWDFHKYTHHNAPLYEHPMDAKNGNSPLNIDHAVKVWQELGLPREKLILGLASYGRGFVTNEWKSDFPQDFLYVAANQGIQAGPFTRERGYQGFNEICTQVKSGGWKVFRDSYVQAPIAVKGTEWIGYDDPQSIAVKSTYARDKNLGGVMVWSLETDDFRGLCSGEKFPLIKTMSRVMNGGELIESSVAEAPDNVITGEGEETEEQKPPPQAPPTQQLPSTPILPLDPNGLCKHEGNNRHPENCSLFYHCKHNGDKWDMTEFHCGQGTAYDPEINVCDFPWNVSGCS